MARAETSTPEERERAVAEAVAHSEAKDAAYRPPSEIRPSGFWKLPLAAVGLALAAAWIVAPPDWLAGPQPPTVTPVDRSLGVEVALSLQAAGIEAFRLRNQRLPEPNEEIPGALPGIRYLRSSDRVYQLAAAGPDGRQRVLDSATFDPGADPLRPLASPPGVP